jgi:hypothetical protein
VRAYSTVENDDRGSIRREHSMGLEAFGLFNDLIRSGHKPARMGLRGTAGDVTRLSYRVRVAKAFRGLKLEGVAPRTTRGYDAFMKVFLTHSALEQYLTVTGQELKDIEAVHKSYLSADLIAEFFDSDRDGKLFEFLHRRLNRHLQERLTACKEKRCFNVGVISASIRHIFAHGHLAANANGINPDRVYHICQKLSDFLLEYIDSDFEHRVRDYASDKNV